MPSVPTRITVTLLTVASSVMLPVAVNPTPAAAWTQSRTYHRDVVQKSVVNANYIDRSKAIGSCTAISNGVGCGITYTMSATRTVQLSLGATFRDVTSQLQISSSTTTAVNVDCHSSTALRKGQRFVAYSQGVRYRYKIHEWYMQTGPDGGYEDVATSGWLYAFDPSTNRIACGIG